MPLPSPRSSARGDAILLTDFLPADWLPDTRNGAIALAADNEPRSQIAYAATAKYPGTKTPRPFIVITVISAVHHRRRMANCERRNRTVQ